MKKYSTELIGLFFVVVLIANVVLFVSSMKLSTEIHEFEQKEHTLSQDNLVLEKQLADDVSFKSLDVYEKKWGFKHATKPVYIGELQFALNNTRQ
jgi:hypothetical protein